jgi:hypothetical protein
MKASEFHPKMASKLKKIKILMLRETLKLEVIDWRLVKIG